MMLLALVIILLLGAISITLVPFWQLLIHPFLLAILCLALYIIATALAGHYFGVAGGLVMVFTPLVILGVFGVVETYRGHLDIWGNPTPKGRKIYSDRGIDHRQFIVRDNRPPTDKQLNYIDSLLQYKDADDLRNVKICTIKQASEFIDELQARPYRNLRQ